MLLMLSCPLCMPAQVNSYKPSEAVALKELGNSAYKEAKYTKVVPLARVCVCVRVCMCVRVCVSVAPASRPIAYYRQ